MAPIATTLIKVTFTATLDNYNTSLWSFHIKVPAAIAQAFLSDGSRRVVCRLNDRLEFQCALMPNGADEFFILVNKKIRDTLQLKLDNRVEVSLRKDESEYGLPMPEEFKVLLDLDPEGDEVFHGLTPGKQRTLLHIVGTVKNTDLRIAKGLVILEHLKKNDGQINFKQLGLDLKNNKFR